MKHQAQIVHHVPGRIRLRLPRAKGKSALLEQIKEALSPRPGVRSVAVNPTTGSVIINYDAPLFDFNKQLAEHKELFTLNGEMQPEDSSAARLVERSLKQLSDAVKEASGDAIDLKEIFPFAVATFALFFVDKTLGAPLWLSLLIFSFSSYMDLHEPEDNINESLGELRAEVSGLRADLHALSHKK
jgi:hypothetical protein